MATTPDYSALENFLLESARRGVQLSGAPKRELTKALSGKDGKITLASLRGGKDTFKKAGGTDYLATIGRTYGSGQLSKEVKEKLKEKDKNIERETINTIDEDDWDSDDKVEKQYSWDT